MSVIDSVICVCSKPKEEVEDASPVAETNDELSSLANVCDPEKYQEVFQARHRLCKLTVMSGELVSCFRFLPNRDFSQSGIFI